MSRSIPASIACRAASRRSLATPWCTSWPIPSQSLVTTPPKPQAPLSRSRTSARWLCIATPSTSWKPTMIARHPGGHGGAERPQMPVVQGVQADREGLVVALGLHQAVAAEVLGRRREPVVGLQPVDRRRARSARPAAARRRTSRRSAPSAAPTRCRPSARRSAPVPRPRPPGPTGSRRPGRGRGPSSPRRRAGSGTVVRRPCTTSLPSSSGIPSRDSSRATRWHSAIVPASGMLARRRRGVRAVRVDPRPHLAGRDLGGVAFRVQVVGQVQLAGLLRDRHLREQPLDRVLDGTVEMGARDPRRGDGHRVSISTSASSARLRRSSAGIDTPPSR